MSKQFTDTHARTHSQAQHATIQSTCALVFKNASIPVALRHGKCSHHDRCSRTHPSVHRNTPEPHAFGHAPQAVQYTISEGELQHMLHFLPVRLIWQETAENVTLTLTATSTHETVVLQALPSGELCEGLNC
eukprot:4098191-Amphidinium_carterae.1